MNYPENVILGSENKVNSHRIERTYLVFFLQVFFSLSVRHSEKTITYLLHFPCAYHAQTRILVTNINMNFSSECNSSQEIGHIFVGGRAVIFALVDAYYIFGLFVTAKASASAPATWLPKVLRAAMICLSS